jgi:3D (Asp-Asp-Asp) domain-containing protein
LRVTSLNFLAATALGFSLLGVPAEAYANTVLGDSARVVGTNGSGLRVRSGPGLSYQILGMLSDGTRVSVLDGPRSGDDHEWYRIESIGGAGGRLRGWASGRYLVAADQVAIRDDGALGTRSFKAKVVSYFSGGGIGYQTSTGTRVRWGVVAVDPRFIPLGSLMTIDGLEGTFIGEDTGGAVRGAVIDVWFPDQASALRWGTQHRTVTVLREGY